MLRADPINSAHLASVQPLKISLPQSSQCNGAAQPPQLCLYFAALSVSLPPSLSDLYKHQIFVFSVSSAFISEQNSIAGLEGSDDILLRAGVVQK